VIYFDDSSEVESITTQPGENPKTRHGAHTASPTQRSTGEALLVSEEQGTGLQRNRLMALVPQAFQSIKDTIMSFKRKFFIMSMT
jgi:hypothetical protein